MSDIAIRVEGLGKQYRIGRQQARYKTIRESLVDWTKAPFQRAGRVLSGRGSAADLDETFWALRDVSFEIKQGEVVGVIGRNGAGKTTLLKLLSRITEPTTGDAWIHGRVGSLLEVGTGFHPELTGRENIFLNGAILGMKRVELDRKFDEIVDFSGIEKFIDTPVKHYSSGMYVRLAFSVAAHLEPDILLVDEVLAVGDAAFQKKCLGKMEDVAKIGRTVLFVSHNMAAVQSLCGSGILIDTGRLVEKGSSRDVINEYLRVVSELTSIELEDRQDRHGDGKFRFHEVVLLNEKGEPSTSLVSGKNATIKLRYKSVKVLKHVSISIGIYGQNGQFLLMCNNEMAGAIFEKLPQMGEIHCTLPRLPFSSGIYQINLYCEANGQLADWIKEAFQLEVIEGDFYGFGRSVPSSHGGFLVDQVWELTPGKK